MALVPLPPNTFPDVPVADGVPAVFRAPQATVLPVLLLQADVISVMRLFEPPQWGIFSSGGIPIAIPDSIAGFDFRVDNQVADFQLEQGGFETYDKVLRPFVSRVRMVCDGHTTPREVFLNQIAFASQSLDLMTVVTPDAVYPSVSITHYDYELRTRNAVTMLQVDVWVEQVRVTVSTQFQDTRAPTGAAPVSDGTVQAQDPTPAQLAASPTPSSGFGQALSLGGGAGLG